MIVSSDPVVTNTRKKLKKHQTHFNKVVLNMLRMPSFCAGDGDDNNDDDEADEDNECRII